MVNAAEFTEEARLPNPKLMLKGYNMAACTLNLLRAFTRGGYAALHRVQAWNQEFVVQSPMGRSYNRLAKQIDQAIRFMNTIGIPTDIPQVNQTQLFTSHEALLLGYEEALTRTDSLTGDWYATSGHMIWIGDRTRQPDHAHIEFCRGVKNPIGLKCGPSLEPDGLLKLISFVGPRTDPGKEFMKKALEAGISLLAVDAIPRTSRAQNLDVLSSQAKIAGYRAVIQAACESRGSWIQR